MQCTYQPVLHQVNVMGSVLSRLSRPIVHYID